MSRCVVRLAAVLLSCAAIAPAQVIPIQPVPLVPVDQFDIFPSLTLAMGGVSIAVADTLHDPFVNPAKATRLRTARFIGSPTFYSVSHDAGAGRTLPLALFSGLAGWYGGFAVALQQLDAGRRTPVFTGAPPPFFRASDQLVSGTTDLSPEAQTHGNALAFATLSRALPGSGISVGASVSWAKLRAADGVDLRYPGSARVEQFGETNDARLGLLKEWDHGASLEALILRNRLRMTHDVTFVDAFWDPGTQQFFQSPRQERNRDVAERWGAQVKYERPLTAGWRIGWLATANRVSQPSVPNGDLLNIPSDPGHANAYELGIGVSRTNGPALFAMDLVYQPTWSTTSAFARTPTVTAQGDTIAVGDLAAENGFHFSNALFRMGWSHDVWLGALGKALALQLGLMVRGVHYTLTQHDLVDLATRRLEESWVEWTPTWGLSFRFPDMELRYRGLASHGTDRMVPQSADGIILAGARPNSILPFPGPSSSMSPTGVHVITHQFSISVPLR